MNRGGQNLGKPKFDCVLFWDCVFGVYSSFKRDCGVIENEEEGSAKIRGVSHLDPAKKGEFLFFPELRASETKDKFWCLIPVCTLPPPRRVFCIVILWLGGWRKKGEMESPAQKINIAQRLENG